MQKGTFSHYSWLCRDYLTDCGDVWATWWPTPDIWGGKWPYEVKIHSNTNNENVGGLEE